MSTEIRLLAHLAHRLPGHSEDIATEGLAFVLERSASLRSAFWEFTKTAVPDLPESVSFRTQVSASGGTRPDIVGFDAAGSEVAMIEVKFWAGLTDNQPVAYLERLIAHRSNPSALIVLAPARRRESLWPELLRLCRERYGDVVEIGAAGDVRVAGVAPGVSLALVTWAQVLDALVTRAEADGDHSAVSDLLQLQSLALREDEDAFLPIKAYELGQEFPHRMVLLANVIDALAGRANAEGIVTTAGLNAASRRSGYGRYLRIADLGAWLGISFDFWRRHRPTPLWLHIEKWGGDTETREQKRLRLKPIEDEGNLVLGDNSDLLIPLSLPLGAEQPAVLDALLEQLRRIHAVLALSTSETNSEPP